MINRGDNEAFKLYVQIGPLNQPSRSYGDECYLRTKIETTMTVMMSLIGRFRFFSSWLPDC